MKLQTVSICMVFLLSMPAIGTADSGWQTGKLLDSEQSKVLEGSTETKHSDGSAKPRGDKVKYESNTTTTKTENYETYQTYTVEGDKYVYVAREHLLFPWSKPADLAVNGPVKYMVSGNKLVILDDSGKQHKAGILKKTLKDSK
jgi:hypothetical protein